MATQQLSQVLQQLRRIYLLKEEANLSDGELLNRFFQHGDGAPFEILVERYGPMVLGVCQRLLQNPHDAEDAFQTVFLVLVHKGRSLLGQEVIGNWLYRVAYNAALKARAASVKRRSKETRALAKTSVQPDDSHQWNELRPLLDEALDKLPDKLREAIVLCDVLGKPRKEVVAQLGVPEKTLSGRLTSARRKLAERLQRAGITLCGAAVTTVLSRSSVLARVPAPLVNLTVKAATVVAAGPTAAAGVVSAQVAALTEGVLKTMFVSKLKSTGTAALALSIVVGGLGIFLPSAQSVAILAVPTSPLHARQEMRASSKPRPVPGLLTNAFQPMQQDQKAGGKKDAPKPPPKIVQAWEDAGAEFGWISVNFSGRDFSKQGQPPSGAVPAFRFVSEKIPEKGILAKLPDPGMAFGLEMDLSNMAIIDLAELNGLNSLQTLWLPNVTDGCLRHVLKLKSLKVLQIGSAELTDEGLKELAHLEPFSHSCSGLEEECFEFVGK